ncbi:MAG: sensor domain-containing diguanylate cyclase [Actinobacteria bacterium]|nr:sensor domain-containing diguanylate cyclase [Actinomycetota bacterium]
MDNRVEAILIGPRMEDLPMIEKLISSGGMIIAAVIASEDNPAAKWLVESGIERFEKLPEVPRLLPGQLLLNLDQPQPDPEIMELVAMHGLSIVNRDAALRMTGGHTEPGAEDSVRTANVLRHYRQLLEDYFPTSKHSSTAVKLAACLTEATTIWEASGGVILTGARGGETLGIAAQRGINLPRDIVIESEGNPLLSHCYSRGKHSIVPELSEAEAELLPGVKPASAALLSIKSGSVVRGVLVLWSNHKRHFESSDLTPLSLFAYYIATLLEIDELGDKLEENLVIDPLTGFHNRRQFHYRLRQEVLRAKRYTLNVSLVVFDIDHLDDYNSACGHMLGNLALSDIASIFKKCTREVDFIARIGGDEFAAILPETNRLGAIRLADRMCAEVASYPFPVPNNKASSTLTLCAGIAAFPSASGTEQDILTKAFKALELAKNKGSNSIKLWDDDLEAEG